MSCYFLIFSCVLLIYWASFLQLKGIIDIWRTQFNEYSLKNLDICKHGKKLSLQKLSYKKGMQVLFVCFLTFWILYSIYRRIKS